MTALPLDEGSGRIAADVVGGHDATIHGAQWVTPGKYGAALAFDGVNDRVSIRDGADLDFEDGFTIEAWVRPNELEPRLRSSLRKTWPAALAICSMPRAAAASRPGYANDTQSLGSVEAQAALPLSTWTHLALTSDGTDLRIYVDGVLDATASAVELEPSDGRLEIGGNRAYAEYLDGRIDEIRIYDSVLGATGIQSDRTTPIDTGAPTDIALSETSVLENEPAETEVGSCRPSLRWPGPRPPTAWSGTSDADNDLFEIDGDSLLAKESLDFETGAVGRSESRRKTSTELATRSSSRSRWSTPTTPQPTSPFPPQAWTRGNPPAP